MGNVTRHRDYDDERSSTNKRRRSRGHDSSFDDHKAKQRVGPVPAHRMAEGGLTLLNVDLCRLHPCHIQHL